MPSNALHKAFSKPGRLTSARTASSSRNGTASATEKGQPTTPAMPNHMMPWAVFSPRRQSINAAMPSMPRFIAKLDGRYAVEAWNMPGLSVMHKRNMIATRPLKVALIVRNRRVSQAAQRAASTMRTK